MSSFNPAFALNNHKASGTGKNSSGLRKGLIVFQFILAQAFIIGAFVMGQQMKYVLHKDLGFEKDAVVYFYTPYRAGSSGAAAFQNRLKQIPEVKIIHPNKTNHQLILVINPT